MANLVTSLIRWALFFGVCGGLVDITIALRDKAARAHQMGLVSLSQLNHALQGGAPKKHSAPLGKSKPDSR